MMGADVDITGFTDEGMPFAEDFYITGYNECSIKTNENGSAKGVCPDVVYGGSNSNKKTTQS